MAKRKTFVAREELINGLGAVAKRKGFSLYDTVNEIFQLALEADELGVNLGKIFEEYQKIQSARNAGFTLSFESLWYEMAEIAYDRAKNKTGKSWFKAGSWLAKRYITDKVSEAYVRFKRDIETFFWDTPEVTIQKVEKEITIRIINPRFTEAYALLLTSFFTGALETLGYNVIGTDSRKGAALLQAVEKGEND